MVVNLDFPNDTETYIHRIGRTARAGKKGFVVSFFVTEKNGRMSRDIIEILNRTQQNVPPELLNAVQTGGGRYGGGGGRGRGGGRRY